MSSSRAATSKRIDSKGSARVDRVDIAAPAAMTSRVGTVLQRATEAAWLVEYRGNVHGPLPARALASAAPGDLSAGCEVFLMFEDGDPRKPVIVGAMSADAPGPLRVARVAGRAARVSLDGDTLVLNARSSVRIECGESSIAMHADGTVIVKGRSIVTRASESNRIKGSTVSIN